MIAVTIEDMFAVCKEETHEIKMGEIVTYQFRQAHKGVGMFEVHHNNKRYMMSKVQFFKYFDKAAANASISEHHYGVDVTAPNAMPLTLSLGNQIGDAVAQAVKNQLAKVFELNNMMVNGGRNNDN